MCKNLSKIYDVELLYKQCDINQLKRLRKYVKCEVYDPSKEYKCDICILASSWGGYPESIISTKNEYWQMIHANYKELAKTGYKYTKWNRTTRYFAVSNTVRDIFNEMYHENATTMYNLLDEVQKTEQILKLISATRLSSEKGYNRMVNLANELKKKNIKFRWLIFTDLKQYNSIKLMDFEEVIYMKPRYDIFDYIKEADFGVQFSDTEGYSYFVNECLQYGTPMIVSNFDSVYESVEDGVSGYILDMDLFETGTKEEWDKYLDKIVNKIPKDFKYEPKCKTEDWLKLLGNPDSKYKEIKKERKDKMKKIRALQNYTDSLLKKNIVIGEEYIVDNERAEAIVKVIFKDKPLAEIIEDIKEEVKQEEKPKTTTKKKATKKK